MEVAELEKDVRFARARLEESEERIEAMKKDLSQMKMTGNENEIDMQKIALFDEMESQQTRRKDIAEKEERWSKLTALPTQSSPVEAKKTKIKNADIEEFCPVLSKSRAEESLLNIDLAEARRPSAVDDRVKVKDAEMLNKIKIEALERDMDMLVEEPRQAKMRPAGMTGMTRTSSMVREIKPHRYKKGDDVCTFLERFQHYVCINNIQNGSLDMLLLSLVDDEKMYKKLRNIQFTLHQSSNVLRLIQEVKQNLFPVTETLILRSELGRLTQKPEESVEDFAIRIEDLAEKAYMDLHLRQEACVSRLMEGAKSDVVRRKLMESDLEGFEEARLLAIKQERIANMISAQEEAKPLIDFETPVYKVGERKAVEVKAVEQTTIGAMDVRRGNTDGCTKCGKTGHGEETCWKDMTCQLCGTVGHVASVCRSAGPVNSASRANRGNGVVCLECGGRGHVRRQCPSVQRTGGSEAGEYITSGCRGFQDHRERRMACYSCGEPGNYSNECPRRQQYQRRGPPVSQDRGPRPQSFEQRRYQRDHLNGYAAGRNPGSSSRPTTR